MPSEFYAISPRHLSLMIKGHENKRIDSYKQTRLLMFTMARLMGDPSTSPKTPEELWQLPGDELSDNVMSDDEIKEMFKRLA